MVSRELADVLSSRYRDASATGDYLDELRTLASA
jgi:hypothetical protein